MSEGARAVPTSSTPTPESASPWSSTDEVSIAGFKIASFTEMLLEHGFKVGTRVLALELEAAEAHIASQLDITPNEALVSLLRVRFADGAPLSLEHMYLSFRRFPTLVDEGLGGVASIYAVLRERYGVSIANAEEKIEITPASPEVAHLLAIEPGDALLAIRRLARDAEGRPVEYSFDLFRGDRAHRTVRTLYPAGHKSIHESESGDGMSPLRQKPDERPAPDKESQRESAEAALS